MLRGRGGARGRTARLFSGTLWVWSCGEFVWGEEGVRGEVGAYIHSLQG